MPREKRDHYFPPLPPADESSTIAARCNRLDEKERSGD